MVQAYEEAKYDIVWVCDSNVYVDPGCLGRSADKMMQPGVGLVHHLPFGVRPQTLGSELELMFLDTLHAKMYLFINWTGLASCVVGKSCLYRRSDLDKVGGLAAFGKFMAEDNLIATAIFDMGYKHEMTSDLAYQSLGSMTSSDYFLRRARWTRIRKYTVTAATVVEPFIEMIGCGLVASYGFNLLWQTHFLNFLAFHVVIWFLLDLSMYQALSGEKMDNLRGFLMTWCLRELAALPLYAYAVLGSTVEWRDQTFVLLRNSTVRPLVNHSTTGTSILSQEASSESIHAGQQQTESMSASSSSPSLPFSKATTIPTIMDPMDTDSAHHQGNPPMSPTTTAFWSKVATPSTQATLRNFFRRPAVISIVSSTFAVVHFVVDILIKSQRNGNDDEEQSDDDDDDEILSDEELDLHGTGTVVSSSAMAFASVGSSSSEATSRLGPGMMARHSRKGKKYCRRPTEFEGDDCSASASASEADVVLLRRSARLKSRGLAKAGLGHLRKHSDDEGEPDADKARGYGHRRPSTEDDALSKAVEPYLSDSLSRRGGGRLRRNANSLQR
ncbi:hypothetical protein BGZ94_000414 [Podila epigama]|nr:hypothetical protein BGZ94_000414 [Podila epigama]